MKSHTYFICTIVFGLLANTQFVVAQNESDFSSFLEASRDDAGKLIEGYTSPVIKGLSYGMSGGWFNTAKTHKPFGIDLGVTINAVFIPTSENYFTPNLSNGTFSNLTNPGEGAPTIFGPKDETNYVTSYDPDGNGSRTITISGPEGLDFKEAMGIAAIPVPMAQIGIGTIKNTDLKIRLVPKTTVGNSDIQMFGIGVMHDIKQHIPGVKNLPFDLAMLAAFNSVKGSTSLVNTDSQDTRPDSQDGKTSYTFNSLVFQAIISKKISILTFYAGAGYSAISSKADVSGTYTVVFDQGSSVQISDPVSQEFSNNSPRFTAGVRFKLGPVYLNGDYTIQKFNNLSVGLGFTIR
jgi:hypothetical protein